MDRKIRLGFFYDRKSWIGDAKELVRICRQIGLVKTNEKLLTGLTGKHRLNGFDEFSTHPHLREVFDTRLDASACDISES